MVAGIKNGSSSRAWYGKMIMPPKDALILESGHKDTAMSYSSYRKLEIQATMATNSSESLPAACGHQDANGILRQLSGSTSLCSAADGSTGLMCWAQCYSVVDLPCGTSAQCVDTKTNETVDGGKMCPDHSPNQCFLQCEPAEEMTFSDYCYGSGTSMIMDGFTSMAFSESGKAPCVNLLFPAWTLDSQLKFALGCVGTFLASMAIPFMTYLRQQLRKGHTKYQVVFSSALTLFLYGLQVTLSYFVMLAAMTYSVEIFTMVCAGLTLGYGVFNLDTTPSSVEPCCDTDYESDDKSANYHSLTETSVN
jgi:hypothetical protein